VNDILESQVYEREAPQRHAANFLLEPPSLGHAVQFYDNDVFLCETVARFANAGLAAGERLLLISTPAHVLGIFSRLDQELLQRARQCGQITVLDARSVLDSFMLNGMPDAERFSWAVEQAMAASRSHPSARLRAFGEMVDLLWRDGNVDAAMRLEELWDTARVKYELTLLCAYGMGNFREHRDAANFHDVCSVHTHVIPAEGFVELRDSEARLREISHLQQQARALESEIVQRKAVESSLREVLEHRMRVEAELRASLEREQDARERAQANDAFKEVFMGILGHDLRNPLNTILTTSRLMTLRGELTSESQRRLDRVIASGVRMQRMIEQILDMTRDRLTMGISVSRTAPRDLVPLVSKIVEEIRLAHPTQRVELSADAACIASVDADRFEQVISNLLGNAATHGDPSHPIQVRVDEIRGLPGDAAAGEVVAGGPRCACISVRNQGRAIDPTFLPLLFDPFRRVRKPEGRSEGLGLGLYISERIVRAHGGQIRVESSAEQGTLFEVVLPCEEC
jgi:signal transduction histidine kinase